MKEIKLGDKAKDIISCVTGIVTGRIEYLNGCKQFALSQKAQKDGKVPDHYWIDEQQLVRIGDGVNKKIPKKKAVGGPMRAMPMKTKA